MDLAIEDAKTRLRALCGEIGLNETEVEGRFRELEYAVDNALSLYVGVVLEEIDGLRDQCTLLCSEIQTMQSELTDVDFDAQLGEIKPPYKPLSLKLEQTKTKLLGWHAQRSKRAKAASERIIHLEAALNQPSTEMPTDLSQNSICKMEARVAELVRLKDARVAELHKCATQAQDLWHNLEMADDAKDSKLAEMVANYENNPDPWLGTDGTIQLWDAVEILRTEQERRQRQVAALTKELQFLYEMLEISQQDDALDQSTLSLERIEALKSEVARLQQAKSAHMSKFIDRAKARLQELWDKMYFSPDEIATFAPFHSTDASEEVLQACHDEIARIEDLVRDPERLHLYALIHRLKLLQSREVELERLEQDPSRFNRRGKERLEEQRMRSSVAKKPQLVLELKTCLEKWQETHSPFLVYGKPILEEVLQEESKLLYRRPRASATAASTPAPAAPASRAPKTRIAAGGIAKPPAGKRYRAPAAALREINALQNRPSPSAASAKTYQRVVNSTRRPVVQARNQRTGQASRADSKPAGLPVNQGNQGSRGNRGSQGDKGSQGIQGGQVNQPSQPSKVIQTTRDQTRRSMVADSSFDDPQMDLWRRNRERDRIQRTQ